MLCNKATCVGNKVIMLLYTSKYYKWKNIMKPNLYATILKTGEITLHIPFQV
jgi:hypothetical protein